MYDSTGSGDTPAGTSSGSPEPAGASSARGRGIDQDATFSGVPEREIAQRGGATRVRTVKLPNGRYRHVFVVRDAGPRGGHTVAGPAKKRKGDDTPTYKVKPEVQPIPLKRRRDAKKA
jgi:hypothetical protein